MDLTPGTGHHLNRQQEAQVEGVHKLRGVHNHHETLGANRHQLFLNVASTTALDQLEGGINLIGTIDRQIDAIDRIQALQRDAQLGRQHLALEGGRDANDVTQLTALELGAEGLNHQGCR